MDRLWSGRTDAVPVGSACRSCFPFQDKQDGPSEILVTDLHNYGMPFIRYRIGDLGVLRTTGRCACGRGLPKLHSIEGRTLDILRTRNGRVVPGELFPHVMKDIPEIEEFQA